MNTLTPKKRVLLVEDDPNLGMLLQEYLKHKNFEVELKRDGVEGLFAFRKSTFDIVLLDVMMPKKDGFTVAEEIRKDDSIVPIIFLTAKSLKEDKIKGLTIGADDYITKPYEPTEFLARIDVLLRRAKRGGGEPMRVLEFRKLRVDLDRRTVTLNGKPIELRRKEFDLLILFLHNPGRLLTRGRLSQALWEDDVVVTENALTSHVKNLRALLGTYGDRVETLVGEGYRFNDA